MVEAVNQAPLFDYDDLMARIAELEALQAADARYIEEKLARLRRIEEAARDVFDLWNKAGDDDLLDVPFNRAMGKMGTTLEGTSESPTLTEEEE